MPDTTPEAARLLQEAQEDYHSAAGHAERVAFEKKLALDLAARPEHAFEDDGRGGLK